MEVTLDKISRAREAGYSDDDIVAFIGKHDDDFNQRIQRAYESGHDASAILGGIEQRVSRTQQPQQNIPQETPTAPEVLTNQVINETTNQVKPKKETSFAEDYARGLQRSASGELAHPLTQKQVEENPGFWSSLVEEAGTITGDMPYILAGTTLGASVGGTLGSAIGPEGTAGGALLGGGFGAMAFPEFLKSAIQEYRDYVDQGNDITFGEFLERANRVGSKTLNSGMMGVILGLVNRSAPVLKKIPGIGKLFTSRWAQGAEKVAKEAATLTAVPAISRGELPTTEDFTKAVALVLGMNATKIPAEIRHQIEKGRKAGKSPEQTAATINKLNKETFTESKAALQDELNYLKEGNRKKVAEKAVENGRIKTPDQLKKFLKDYDEKFPSIKGKTVNDRNRKFLNKYSYEIKTVTKEGKKQAEPPKLSEEQKLKQAVVDLRRAKYEGDKAAIKEAQKRIDLQKRKIEKQKSREKPENKEKPSSKPEEKPIAEHESAESKQITKNIEKIEGQIAKAKKKPNNESVLRILNKNLALQKKKQAALKKKRPPKPIIETTGRSASESIEYPKTKFERAYEAMGEAAESAKTPVKTVKVIGEKANTAIFNALAPLERAENASKIGTAEAVSTRIKLAKTAASEINSTIRYGIFNNNEGTFKSGSLADAYGGDLVWRYKTKGLKPGEYSLEEMNAYRTDKIALRRQAQGRKTGVDTVAAQQEVAKLGKKYEPVDKKIREFQKATIREYGKDLLGPELIQNWNSDYYSPLYRVMDYGPNAVLKAGSLEPKQPFYKMKGSTRKIIPPSESDVQNVSLLITNARKNDSILQYKKLVEQGKLPGKVRKGSNDKAPKNMVKDLGIDPKQRKLADQLYSQTRKDAHTPSKNVLRGWEEGKPFEIEVPDDIYNVFQTFVPQSQGIIPRVFQSMNRLFSKGISKEPRKMLSILLRDRLSSLIYSRTNTRPVSAIEALSDIYGEKEIYKEFLSLGGDVYAARLGTRIDRANKIEDLITPGHQGKIISFKRISDLYNKIENMSLAVPYAEYKKGIKKYGNTPEGRLMAAIEARKVTYDPTRKGGSKIVSELGNYIPFWNVSLQEFSQMGQGMKRLDFWMKGLLGVSLPSLLLKMINEDNPDYQALTPEDKAAFWHIYSGNDHYRIPIPWLLGTLFKNGAEAFFDLAKGRGGEGWQGLYANFVENLTGSVPSLLQAFIQGTTGKTAPSPIGLIAGTESRAPDVVPKRVQHLPPEQQYTNRTSYLAKKFGQFWGVSPAKVETITKTMGGLVAADALALVDEIAYATGLEKDKRPEQREKNYLLLGHFVSDNTPSRTKYQQKFYEHLDKQNRSKAAGEKVGKVNLSKYNSEISKLFKKMREIEDSDINPKEKKQRMTQLQKQINQKYKEAVDKYEK